MISLRYQNMMNADWQFKRWEYYYYANKNKVFSVIFVGHMGLKHVYLVQIRYLEHNLVKSELWKTIVIWKLGTIF